MADDLDTKVIRALVHAPTPVGPIFAGNAVDVLALCDALDAARAEADRFAEEVVTLTAARVRAERAEAANNQARQAFFEMQDIANEKARALQRAEAERDAARKDLREATRGYQEVAAFTTASLAEERAHRQRAEAWARRWKDYAREVRPVVAAACALVDVRASRARLSRKR